MFMLRSIGLLLFTGVVFAAGTVTNDTRISSAVLGYDLQYRVYAPAGYDSLSDLPVLYLTDGPGFISEGRMPHVLDKLIADQNIGPIVAVFVDARNPDNLRDNRRNAQFLCNKEYLKFYVDELIPEIEENYPVNSSREGRAIMGLSFGGLNAACFGLFGVDTFSGLGMLSPANHPVPALLSAYAEMPLLPLKIFLSTGRPDDNTQANRKFRTVLQEKGYDMKYIEVTQDHNWDNWRPLLDDVLLYFYAREK